MSENIHPYSQDPYLRSLALSKVRCLGSILKDTEPCSSCPLQAECLNAVQVRKAEIAARLDQEEQEAIKAAAAREAEKAKSRKITDELIQKASKNSDKKKGGGDGRFLITSGMTYAPGNAKEGLVCLHCGDPIPEGSKSMWVKGEGTFHMDCVHVEETA